MRAVVVVVVAALAAPAAAQPLREIPPPATLVARPLADGQWVEYREHWHGTDAGHVVLGVVKHDACGTWFEALLENQGKVRTWHVCVAADHTIAKALRDDSTANVDIHDDELSALVSRVLPPAFTGTFVRKDVEVPAGRFHEALRRDGASMTWLHPAVPLGAVIRVVQGDRIDELIAYGDSVPPMTVAHRARATTCCRRPRYYEFALGAGHLTGVGSGETGSMSVLGLGFGTVVTSTTDVVFSMMVGDSSEYSDTKSSASALLTATGGVRLLPLRLHPGAEAGLYVQAELGYASLKKGADDIVGNGVALVPAIGWQTLGGRDWSMGIQASDELALLNRSVGFRQVLDITVAIDLWLR